jgi:hypothetical protein
MHIACCVLQSRDDAVYLEGRFGRAVQLGEVVLVRKSAHPLRCFSRVNPSCDWIYDLGARLAYERQVSASQPHRDL